MKSLTSKLFFLVACLLSENTLADAKVMYPGEAFGQLVYLSVQDVMSESPKFKSLYSLSIPVFEELPAHLTVVAGAITMKQQNQNSHVQLKSKARKTPNLDISELEGGMLNELFKPFQDGDWIHMVLGKDGSIKLEPSTEQAAVEFHKNRQVPPVNLKADLTEKRILASEELGWRDFDKVGSKAANYSELLKVVNTRDRTVTRPGYAIPFYYYEEFINSNPAIKSAIEQILRDPLMNKDIKVDYRERKLTNLQNLIRATDNVINQNLINELIEIFDSHRTPAGLPRKMKLRSSTNSEDLPNFNGAGLYDSYSYKPTEKDPTTKKVVERSRAQKEEALKLSLRGVWASVWNLRAYDERNLFKIPHGEVKMGVQINLGFGDELVDGVVVTKNTARDPRFTGEGVYIEAQRGDTFSVANPAANTHPERILVLVDRNQVLEKSAYQVIILQRSNIADDTKTILPNGQDNPNPMMTDEQIKELVFQSLKAELHFKTLFGVNNPKFALDLEFKVDNEDSKSPEVFLKQARPYIDDAL